MWMSAKWRTNPFWRLLFQNCFHLDVHVKGSLMKNHHLGRLFFPEMFPFRFLCTVNAWNVSLQVSVYCKWTTNEEPHFFEDCFFFSWNVSLQIFMQMNPVLRNTCPWRLLFLKCSPSDFRVNWTPNEEPFFFQDCFFWNVFLLLKGVKVSKEWLWYMYVSTTGLNERNRSFTWLRR